MKKKALQIEPANDNKALFVTLLALLAIVPVLMVPNIADMYALPKATLLYLGALTLIAMMVRGWVVAGEIKIVRSPLDLAVLLFVLVGIVSALASYTPLISLVGKYRRYEGIPALLSFAVIYFTARLTIKTESQLAVAIKYLTLGLIPVVIYGLVQASGYDFANVFRFENRVHSSLGNPILFGTYLVVMMPLVYAQARRDSSEVIRIGSWALLGAALFNLVATESRGAWFGFAVSIGAAITSWHLSKQKSQRSRAGKKDISAKQRGKGSTGTFAIVIAVIILLVGLLFAVLPGSQLASRMTTTFQLGEGSVASRIETWKSAAHMVADRPLLGFGYDQMGYWFSQYQTQAYKEINPDGVADRTHNDILQVAVDTGIIGMLGYAWIATYAVMLLFRRKGRSVYMSALAAALCGYLAQGLTGIPAVFITPLLWFMVGVAAGTGEAPENLVKFALPARIKPAPVTYITALICIILGAAAIFPIIADRHIFKAQNEAMSSANPAYFGLAAPRFRTAVELYPYQTAYDTAATEYFLDYASKTQNPIFAKEASFIAKTGLSYNPRDFELTYYVAEAAFLEYQLSENAMVLSEASVYYNRTNELRPDTKAVLNRLLLLAIFQKDEAEALRIAHRMDELGMNDPDALMILAREAEGKGEQQNAAAYKERLGQVKPEYLERLQATK